MPAGVETPESVANARHATTTDAKQHAKDRRSFVGCLIGLLVLAGLGVTVTAIVMRLTAGGNDLIRLRLPDAPVKRDFVTEGDGLVEIWTDLELTHRGVSYQTANEDLPHVLDDVVAIEKDGKSLRAIR